MKDKIKLRLSTNQRQRVALYFLISLCQIAIYYIFKDQISKMNEVGLVYAPNSTPLTLPFGIALTSCFVCILPPRIDRFLCISIWIMYLLLVMPGCVMIYSLGFEHLFLDFCLYIVLPIAVMSALLKQRGFAKITAAPWNIDRRIIQIIIALAMTTGGYLFVIKFNTLSFDFLDVYTRRFAERSTAKTLDAYLLSAFSGALAPFLLAYGLQCRDRWIVSMSILGFILVFCIEGTKASLFIPCILILTHFAIKFKLYTPLKLITVILIGLAASYLIDNYDLHLNGLRRIICAPMVTICWYFEYFPNSGFLWGRDMFLVSFLTSSDILPSPGMQTGDVYFRTGGGTNNNANAFSVGFAEGGTIGAWISALLLFFCLSLFEKVTRKSPVEFAVLIAIPLAFRFCEQGLHTAMLSGGVVVLFLILLIVNLQPRNAYQKCGSLLPRMQ